MAEQRAGSGLSVAVLGALRVEHDGHPVALGGRQQRAVLASLLVHHPRPRGVDQLADDLWAGQQRAGYQTTVQSYVHRLRQALEPERAAGSASAWRVITRDAAGYRLDLTGVDFDVDRYRAAVGAAQEAARVGDHRRAHELAVAAEALWHGEPLADLAELAFVVPWAERLRELRVGALEVDFAARLALGETDTVAAELSELLTAYPWRERLHELRLLALYRAGRQAEALAAYRSLYAAMGDELGVEPGPRLRQLQRDILAQESSLTPAGEARTDPEPAAEVPVLQPVAAREPAAGRRPPLAAPTAARPSVLLSRRPRGVRRLAGSGVLVAILVVAALIGLVDSGNSGGRAASLISLPTNAIGIVASDGGVARGPDIGPDAAAVVTGGDSVWVALGTSGLVLRIDPDTRQVVDRIPVGRGPAALVYTAGALWVANSGDGTVVEVDPAAGQVVRTVRVGGLPTALAAGRSGVWVAEASANAVQRIDPSTGNAGIAIDVGSRPSALAVTDTSVWVANTGDATLTELDAATGRVMSGAIPVGSGPSALVITGHELWVADEDEGAVDRVDTRTGQVVGRVRVGDGPVGAVAIGSEVWIGNRYDGRLTRFDQATGAVRSTVSSGASIRAIAAVDDRAWVAAAPLNASTHLGGTVTMVAAPFAPGDVVGLDPANMFRRSDTVRALRLVYDGLVTYRAGGGAAGSTLVPDLAEAIPRPSDGGRTYVFTVRSGVRFSTGAPVHASDIARGVQRALTVRPDNPLQESGLLGAEGCGQPDQRCDLSRALFADDVHRRIVFHLTAPDPNFLYRLVYASQATPAGAPATEAPTSTALAGTGPYRIARYVEGRELLLTRQPYFRPWSYAAQPPGNPDQIRFVAQETSSAIAATLAGQVDVVRLRATDPGVSEVVRAHPAQVASQPSFGLSWLYLNTTVAPFNDVRVRQAINLAVDRRTVVSIMGGLDQPACQTLPPDFPGSSPYCPYTTGEPTAAYAGPDLTAARALVAASRTAGQPVSFLARSGAAPDGLWSYLAGVLDSLGYRTTVTRLSDDDYYARLGPTAARGAAWQVMYGPNWIADYPAASNFYFPLYACDAPFAPSAHYCDPDVDATARRAAAAEGSDPGTARALWQQVDRTLTEQGAIVSLLAASEVNLVSTRVHNYVSTTFSGPLLDQLWVH